MVNLFNYSRSHLEEYMFSINQSKYRATQIFKWIYEKGVTDFDKMSDVAKPFREYLKENFYFHLPKIYKRENSVDGTVKLLVELEDSAKVETVLMRYSYGNAVCVSSQVGCNMGCSFCASGLLGKQRNLTSGEIMGQILVMNQLLLEEGNGEKVTHVVVMGTGEPFDNYDNVMEFIRIINDQHGLAIGARHITVSTCGIIEGIKKYAKEGLQTNLALSLHAPNNETRNKLMKINIAYPLEKVMEAIREYESTTNRRVTYEYILLSGINDSKEDAEQLINLIKGTMGYVNLIPYNETNLFSYKRSSGNRVHAFLDYLVKGGVKATIRKDFGNDINAACGQLKAKEKDVII